MNGHNYDHGRGDVCQRCGRFHIFRHTKEFKSRRSIVYKGSGNPNYGNHPVPWNKGNSQLVVNICEWCRHTFIGYASRVFCSKSCRGLYQFNFVHPWKGRQHSALTKKSYSISRSGFRNSNWRGGQLPYVDFTLALRRAVREVYGGHCILCGRTQRSNGKGKRQLSVHHIDDDKMNNNFYNLVPLCSYCHSYLTSHHLTVRFESGHWITLECSCDKKPKWQLEVKPSP